MTNTYDEVDKFRDKLSGNYIDEKEYRHRLEYFIGSVVQILEAASIDDKSRRLIVSEISKVHDGVSEGCTLQFHQEYRKWCELNA
jgi:hypothetical protein